MANYFHEEIEHKRIVKYLSLDNRKLNPDAIQLRKDMSPGIGKIVKGIIYTHRYTKYDLYDDLYQHANMCCMEAIERFNPDYIIKRTGKKVSFFNYLSLTAKHSLRYFTIKQAKHRAVSGLPQSHDFAEDTFNRNESLSHVDEFIKILRDRFTHWKYKPIINLFEKFLYYNKGYFDKKTLFLYNDMQEERISNSRIRRFIIVLKENKEYLRDLL